MSKTNKPIGPCNYLSAATPANYACHTCGATGVRLYREYQTFADQTELLCTAHALADQKKTAPDTESGHSTGWHVAAVPCEEGGTFWGYTSVPRPGVTWWDQLPV